MNCLQKQAPWNCSMKLKQRSLILNIISYSMVSLALKDDSCALCFLNNSSRSTAIVMVPSCILLTNWSLCCDELQRAFFISLKKYTSSHTTCPQIRYTTCFWKAQWWEKDLPVMVKSWLHAAAYSLNQLTGWFRQKLQF